MTDLSSLPTSLAGGTGSGVLGGGVGVGAGSSGAAPSIHLSSSSSSLSSSRLSASEHAYLSGGVACNMRSDGRARLDYRPFTVETDVVPHANGSARLRLGAATDVLVAVNLSMHVPEPAEHSAQGTIACSVEHSAACAVDLDERAVQAANSHLTAELHRVLSESGSLPLRSLVIIPDKQCWLVNIDVIVMDNGGNLLDAIVMAVKAAMLTTTIPPLEIVTGDGGAAEIIVNDDPFAHIPLPGASRLPLTVTLCKIGGANEWIIDGTSDEEQCSTMRLTLSLSPDGRMCGMAKAGVGTINLQALEAIMAHAAALGVQLNKLLADEVKRGRGELDEGEGEGQRTQGGKPAIAASTTAATAAKANSGAGSKKKKKQQAMTD